MSKRGRWKWVSIRAWNSLAKKKDRSYNEIRWSPSKLRPVNLSSKIITRSWICWPKFTNKIIKAVYDLSSRMKVQCLGRSSSSLSSKITPIAHIVWTVSKCKPQKKKPKVFSPSFFTITYIFWHHIFSLVQFQLSPIKFGKDKQGVEAQLMKSEQP